MNIQRFHAPTSREALAQARSVFGEGTLILSNRPTATGVEVVATAEDTLSSLEAASVNTPVDTARAKSSVAQPRPQQQAAASPAAKPVQPRRSLAERAQEQEFNGELPRGSAQVVAKDTEQLAMSTLSFQDYVRERMLRRRHEALHGMPSSEPEPRPTFERVREQERAIEQQRVLMARPVASQPAQPARVAARQTVQPAAQAMPQPIQAPAQAGVGLEMPSLAASAQQQHLMQELQSMKSLIEERFSTLAWLGQTKQNPIQSTLMHKLIRAGYSPALSRAVLEHLPAQLSPGDAVQWLIQVLERNLRTDAHSRPLYEESGIFAMVGPTGVGKTTTTAKLAAHCARLHGAESVGLITLDTYRIGAHEQLRTYGRMLGVVAHLAHDRAALQDLLGLLSSKKMVFIDSTGVAPRDPRKGELLDLLDLPSVNRLLVLNASSHGDTLDDVLMHFKTTGSQQAILSKADESVKLGPALDALIRHQMVLRGVTNGQRVPEDWQAANAHELVASSMRANIKSAFDPKATELNFFFSHAPAPAHAPAMIQVS